MKQDLEHSKRSAGDNNDGLISIFEQSWGYIRHSQNMFWQSFAALFTIIATMTLFSLDKGLSVKLVASLSSLVLALMGFCVSNRIITILREHFVTINLIRKKLGIDDIPNVILARWKRYTPEDFGVMNKEIIHVFIASQLYILTFSSIVGYIALSISSYPSPIRAFLATKMVIVSLVIFEFYGWKYVYKYKFKHNEKKNFNKKNTDTGRERGGRVN